ncbi:MAG: hypothetical protein V5B36_18255 [Candidatus Accumulibacter sp. UW25]|jgi:hypothetical protein
MTEARFHVTAHHRLPGSGSALRGAGALRALRVRLPSLTRGRGKP